MIMFSHVNFAIAIVGEKAAGKDAVAELLCAWSGAAMIRYSDPIRVAHLMAAWGTTLHTSEQLAALTAQVFLECGWDIGGISKFDAEFYSQRHTDPPSTFTLQDIGNQLHTFCRGALTHIVLRVADALGKRVTVINGVRSPEEPEPLKDVLPGRHVLVGVCADLEVRKKRFLEGRRRIGDPVTEEDFLRLDRRDKGEGEPLHGQQVAKCLEMVSPENMIYNNGTLDELQAWVKNWYTALAARHNLPMKEE